MEHAKKLQDFKPPANYIYHPGRSTVLITTLDWNMH